MIYLNISQHRNTGVSPGKLHNPLSVSWTMADHTSFKNMVPPLSPMKVAQWVHLP